MVSNAGSSFFQARNQKALSLCLKPVLSVGLDNMVDYSGFDEDMGDTLSYGQDLYIADAAGSADGHADALTSSAAASHAAYAQGSNEPASNSVEFSAQALLADTDPLAMYHLHSGQHAQLQDPLADIQQVLSADVIHTSYHHETPKRQQQQQQQQQPTSHARTPPHVDPTLAHVPKLQQSSSLESTWTHVHMPTSTIPRSTAGPSVRRSSRLRAGQTVMTSSLELAPQHSDPSSCCDTGKKRKSEEGDSSFRTAVPPFHRHAAAAPAPNTAIRHAQLTQHVQLEVPNSCSVQAPMNPEDMQHIREALLHPATPHDSIMQHTDSAMQPYVSSSDGVSRMERPKKRPRTGTASTFTHADPPSTPARAPRRTRVTPVYRVGERVWAKCGGYPWWPAVVHPLPLFSSSYTVFSMFDVWEMLLLYQVTYPTDVVAIITRYLGNACHSSCFMPAEFRKFGTISSYGSMQNLSHRLTSCFLTCPLASHIVQQAV